MYQLLVHFYEWWHLYFLWLTFFVLVYVGKINVSALWWLHFPSLFVRVLNVVCVCVFMHLSPVTCHLSTTAGYRGETGPLWGREYGRQWEAVTTISLLSSNILQSLYTCCLLCAAHSLCSANPAHLSTDLTWCWDVEPDVRLFASDL